jgi:hypothetical protein
MCKRFYRASSRPEFRELFNELSDAVMLDRAPIKVTACKKANLIGVEAKQIIDIFHVVKNINGCSPKEFLTKWKNG